MKRYFIALVLALCVFGTAGFTAGCAANHPVPQTAGQSVVDAYGTLEKAALVTTRLLQSGVITVEQAIKYRDQIVEAANALDAAQFALNLGDTSTALGKLQAAQLLLDTLAKFIIENGGAQ